MHFAGKYLVFTIPPLFDAPRGGTPFTPLEITFTGLQFCRDIMGLSSFF